MLIKAIRTNEALHRSHGWASAAQGTVLQACDAFDASCGASHIRTPRFVSMRVMGLIECQDNTTMLDLLKFQRMDLVEAAVSQPLNGHILASQHELATSVSVVYCFLFSDISIWEVSLH